MKLLAIVLGLTVASLAAQPLLAVTLEAATAAGSDAEVDAFVADNDDPRALLNEIDRTLEKVRGGEYGAMSSAELDAMARARGYIARQLRGHSRTSDLDDETRIAVYNAQELITALIRGRPYDQRICSRTVPIGTRIATYECLSYAQREERTLRGRDTTQRLQENGLLCRRGTC